MLLFLLLILFPVQIKGALEVSVLGDERVPIGAKVELVCAVTGMKNGLNHCMWVAPNKTEYDSFNSQKNPDADISVYADSRRDECVLTINQVKKSQSGYWECVIEDDRDVIGKFVFLRTYQADGSAPLKLLLDQDGKVVTTERGKDVELKCPSNNVAKYTGQRPACRWLSPTGQSITLVGNYGEVHDYSSQGFELGGDIDEGECAIRIKNVDLVHTGTWMCTLLRRSRIEYGSEAASAEIKLEVLRNARLNKDAKLQGFTRNDQDVRLEMEVEIGPEEKFTDLYWIVQRQFVIHEGESNCPISKSRCYTSTKRRLKSGNTYQIELTIDELTPPDIDDPIVLVKDFRERNGEDSIEIFFVPKISDKDGIDKPRETESVTIPNGEKRKRPPKNKGKSRQDDSIQCLIGKDAVDVDDYVDYPDLCVRLSCKSGGVVEPSALSDDDCRPIKRARGQGAERQAKRVGRENEDLKSVRFARLQ